MIAWWLILVAVILSLLIVGLGIYIVVIFVAENDKMSAWFPKAVVVFGLTLASVTVLLLPFDVANRQDPVTMSQFGGGLDLALGWQILLWTDASMIVVIIPFATFFYEAFDPEQYSFAQQLAPAATYTLILVILFGALCGILWATVGYAVIPYYLYSRIADDMVPNDAGLRYSDIKTKEELEIGVSIFVYVVGIMCAVGWVFFCIFGGVGLTALPVDTMSDFMNRPKPISIAQFNDEKARIGGRAIKLIEAGKQLEKSKNNRRSRNKINALRAEVMILEKDLERTIESYENRGTGPIKALLMVLVALFGGIISLLWIMHVFLYNATKVNGFLNSFLVDLDRTFALFGVLAYAIFSYYLLWATVKGCFKVGLRLVFFQIHPMKIGDTLMNAMLFNCGLVLLCSIVVTQFCAMSFDVYASNTVIDGLLNLYVRRLKGIGVIMYYFQYAFIAVAGLSVFWLILCPRKKVVADDKNKDSDED
jgi:LMBR1 domain-containing protein 1